MRNATKVTVSTFGVLAGLAGIEHGIGETLQGNRAPDGIMIVSWPESELFRIVGGEPAMTIVPNLRVTGILAILVSLVFLVWVTMFVQRKHSSLVLILLSFVMLLVGGGFGPPLLGVILGVAATMIHAPFRWWRAHLSRGAGRVLRTLWPWSFVAGVLAWLFLFPGSLLLDYVVGVNHPGRTISMSAFAAFVLLLLTIFTGFAYDMQPQTDLQQSPAMSG
jgi:hypothetical protein